MEFATRSPIYGDSRALQERIIHCLEGASLATGCTVEFDEYVFCRFFTPFIRKISDFPRQPPYLDMRLNHTLNRSYVGNMAAYGENIQYEASDSMSASTDMGSVSYEIPGLHAFFGIPCPKDVSGHHPSFTQASGTEEAFNRAVRCGKGLALTGWDVISDPEVLQRARHDFDEDCQLR